MNRVTHRSIQESTLSHLQGNLAAMAKLQEQVSTGKRINRPSDDPSGTVSSLQLRQQLRQAEQYERNAEDGTAWLATTDTALQTTSSQLRAARTLVVQALNTGASSTGSQAAVAVELEGINQTVQALARTQYNGRSVFAGTSGGSAMTASPDPVTTGSTLYTWAATGDGAVSRKVDSSADVRVDTSGRKVFGDDTVGNPSVFSLLDEISAKIKDPTSSPRELSAMLGDLDTRIGSVLEGLADVGARANRIENAQSVAADTKVALTTQLSSTEDTDVPSAIIDLQMQQTAYTAALTASAKVLQTSLMDFLR